LEIFNYFMLIKWLVIVVITKLKQKICLLIKVNEQMLMFIPLFSILATWLYFSSSIINATHVAIVGKLQAMLPCYKYIYLDKYKFH